MMPESHEKNLYQTCGLIKKSQLLLKTGFTELLHKLEQNSVICENIYKKTKSFTKRILIVDKKLISLYKLSKKNDLFDKIFYQIGKKIKINDKEGKCYDRKIERYNSDLYLLFNKLKQIFVQNKKIIQNYKENYLISELFDKQSNLIKLAGNIDLKFSAFISKTIKLKKSILNLITYYKLICKKLSILYLLIETARLNNDVRRKTIKSNGFNDHIDKNDGQRAFNKYVKYNVTKTFGEKILIHKQIRELDKEKMRKIKEKAIAQYLPCNTSSKDAWNSAMNSLRQIRHQQKKHFKILQK